MTRIARTNRCYHHDPQLLSNIRVIREIRGLLHSAQKIPNFRRTSAGKCRFLGVFRIVEYLDACFSRPTIPADRHVRPQVVIHRQLTSPGHWPSYLVEPLVNRTFPASSAAVTLDATTTSKRPNCWTVWPAQNPTKDPLVPRLLTGNRMRKPLVPRLCPCRYPHFAVPKGPAIIARQFTAGIQQVVFKGVSPVGTIETTPTHPVSRAVFQPLYYKPEKACFLANFLIGAPGKPGG